jgi:FlaA1/EpsC-like NDP-sugar epimerase
MSALRSSSPLADLTISRTIDRDARSFCGQNDHEQTLGLPSTGVVLIGTSPAIRIAAAQLAASTFGAVIPVGCVLVNHFDTARFPATDIGILPPVLGYSDDLLSLHSRYQFRAAIISMPASMNVELRRISAMLKSVSIAQRFVPTFEDVIKGSAPVRFAGMGTSSLDVSQLIGRTPWGVDKNAVSAIIRNKRIMITGAGGSIGSQLARVVSTFGPSEVVLVERAENALFEIDQALARNFPAIKRHAVLHDVVDESATKTLLANLKPDVVFHAAAHKHVPLMEDHPAHAITNNLFGTRSIADAAVAAGVGRFVMISSDKAVNPTSVMGATKRLAEMYVQSLARSTKSTRLSMVRFGNVLASACSVIPIWSSQLAEGHPITVTDPRMTRYFMTIPEAATLVVQAAALEQSISTAPVYVLDMGVSFVSMAMNQLSIGKRSQSMPRRIRTSEMTVLKISTTQQLTQLSLPAQDQARSSTKSSHITRKCSQRPLTQRLVNGRRMLEQMARLCFVPSHQCVRSTCPKQRSSKPSERTFLR